MGAKGLSSRAIIGEFYLALEQDTGQSWLNSVAMKFDSDQESETYKWLGMVPAMREWIGGRHAKGFRDNGFTIWNKKFEATLEVLVDDMRRDKTGQTYVRIRELAERAKTHWQKLVIELIVNGASSLCYDGQYFFDTDHSEGISGSQSNKIEADISTYPTAQHGIITAPSAGEMVHAIYAGIQQMLMFKDDQGEPMNENANNFLVTVPINLLNPSNAAVKSKVLASGEDNTLANSDFSITVKPSSRLSAAGWNDKFTVIRTDGQVKPFVLQEEEGVKVKALAEDSELEFNEDKHQYGIKAIRNAGYGYWQQAVHVTLI
jgi:phage major head subunit gpT-like protein